MTDLPKDLASRVDEFNRRVEQAAAACLPWWCTHPVALTGYGEAVELGAFIMAQRELTVAAAAHDALDEERDAETLPL